MTPDLNAQIYQRLHPRAYFERFLAEQVRPDSREAEEWRDIFVHVGSISTADGSALVRLGETTIVCGVKAEIAEPDLERPTEGFIGMCLSLLQYIAERLQSRILTFRLCAHRDSNRDPHPRRHRYFRTDLHQQSLRASSLPFTLSPLTSLISQGRCTPALGAMHPPRACSLGAVRRHDVHQLRRKCV